MRSPLHLESSSIANRDLQRSAKASNSLPNSPLIRSPKAPQSPSRPVAPSPGPSSPLARHPSAVFAGSPLVSQSRASKSPSAIPDQLPYQYQEEPERLIAQPLAIDTAQGSLARQSQSQSVPHTPITPSKLALHKEISISPEHNKLNTLNLSEKEHIVPLALQPRIQQQYCTTIRYHARAIKTFFEERPCQQNTIQSINHLLDEVSKVSTHIDLQGSGSMSQENIDLKGEADYAESCSTKFAFLGQLLERAGGLSLDLCIVAKAGSLMSILEIYLRAKDIICYQVGEPYDPHSRRDAGLRIFLVQSDGSPVHDHLQWPQPHLIIGFDETFQKDNISFFHWDLPSIPVMRLIVYASLEHIDMCVSRTLKPIERLQQIVYLLLQTQRRVGIFDAGGLTLDDHARAVFRYARDLMMTKVEDPWPLPPLRPIENVSHMESDLTLSDGPSEIFADNEVDEKLTYWPYLGRPNIKSERTAKRPFVSYTCCHIFHSMLMTSRQDIEWGDSLAVQTKKQKIGEEYRTVSDRLGVKFYDKRINLLLMIGSLMSRHSVLPFGLPRQSSILYQSSKKS